MLKKCKTKCQADKHLWIRNDVFYYMVELPRNSDGKRRYFCKSLHTTNYYEAKEKIKTMVVDTTNQILEVKAYMTATQVLMKQINFDESTEQVGVGEQMLLHKVKRISDNNPPELVQQFMDCLLKLSNINRKVFQTLDEDDQKIIKSLLTDFKQDILDAVIKLSATQKPSLPTGNHTIEYIMDSMLKSLSVTAEVVDRKRRTITKMVGWTGLTMRDKYATFYSEKYIQKIGDAIKAMNVKNNVKRRYAMELKNLIKYAHELEPELYKTNLINVVPKFNRTQKEDFEPHWPYTNDELKQIFDPSHDYFKSNPDVFWTTLIAMFVGARCNAALTLQYADIISVDGIYCIKFQNTHPIKQLKNAATRRTVPIPQQLLDLGFVDWVKRQQSKFNMKPTDFIFPRCQTKFGTYNNKFTTRGLIKYIADIGITENNPHTLDFHSLRKNANQRLEEVGVPETFINDIIGWEGKNTRQQSYSNHYLVKIKEQADKLRYDFLQSEFDYWKTVMANL